MSSTPVPSLSSLASVRFGELTGWCMMLRRSHPDMDEVVSAVEESGRKIINRLEADGDVAGLLSIGIVGAAVDAYEATQTAEPASDAGAAESVAL